MAPSLGIDFGCKVGMYQMLRSQGTIGGTNRRVFRRNLQRKRSPQHLILCRDSLNARVGLRRLLTLFADPSCFQMLFSLLGREHHLNKEEAVFPLIGQNWRWEIIDCKGIQCAGPGP